MDEVKAAIAAELRKIGGKGSASSGGSSGSGTTYTVKKAILFLQLQKRMVLVWQTFRAGITLKI